MSCRGFEPVCTANEARKFFKSRGLSYDSIHEGDILILCMMLQKELKKSNKAGETSVTITLSKRVDMKKKSNGSITECYIYMNAHYFTRRELLVGLIREVPTRYFVLSWRGVIIWRKLVILNGR